MTDAMQQYEGWIGRDAVDVDGDKIGQIEALYADDTTGQPEWLAIKTGMFGSKLSFAPLSGATADGEDLRLPFSKAMVKDAPNVDPDGNQLEADEEAALYRHYDRAYEQVTGDTNEARGAEDDAMTRSEEEVQVDKRQVESGRVRLRKYIVTEDVNVTVPVQREEVRLEREPITDANRDQATEGADITEAEHEMTLMEEEVVVTKQAVPKERVRLEKDVVAEQEQVSETVRKEQIEIDGDAERDRDQR